MGLVASVLSRLSVLPCTLLGGVRGDERCGRSVGLRAAGTYNGDFGGRSWRVARGRLGKSGALCGEAGDKFRGVPAVVSIA